MDPDIPVPPVHQGSGLAAKRQHHFIQAAYESRRIIKLTTLRQQGLIKQADGGTLFLDEIGEMPLGLQAKLLKAVEDRSVRRVGGNREIKPTWRSSHWLAKSQR